VFKKVLQDYKDEKIDIGGLKVRVKGLFIEHKELISGFNTFVPKEHQITPRLELEDGLAFYKAVKNVFQDKKESFDEFLNLMMDWKCERVDIRSFVAQMKELLKEHMDLILGFNVFLLTKCQITIPFQLDVPETNGK
jgi:histone deacetylase complex regulatory component SIN3